MSSPFIKKVTSARDQEIDKLTDILVEAFNGDPFSLILLGGDLSLAHAELAANIRAALIGGEVHALFASADDDEPLGVAIWYPPGKSVFASAEERAAGWDQFLAGVPAALRVWWTDYFGPTMGRLSTESLGEGYSLNAWHLHLFGVLPQHQGKGYGRALFEFAEKQANATGSSIVVETTTEVDLKIYTKLGCRAVGETDIKSDYGNAHVWLMVKENGAGFNAS